MQDFVVCACAKVHTLLSRGAYCAPRRMQCLFGDRFYRAQCYIAPMNVWNTLKAQPRWLVALLLALLAVHVGVSFFHNAQRFFIPDEIVYYLMSKALLSGSLAIQTGYEMFASPLFVFGLSVEAAGRVLPQYPIGYAVLALPFMWAFGKAGLFAISAICFAAIVWLVWQIQMLLFHSRFSAWAAAFLTAFGGFLWLYSQALAPHLLQITLLLMAAYAMLRAHLGQTPHPARHYVLAGCVFGAALCLRLDTIFALPMLLLPALFAQPVRLRALMLLLIGVVAAFAVLSLTNYVKFGTYAPFSYATRSGDGHAQFKPLYAVLMFAGAGAVALLWGASRLAMRGRLPSSKWLLLAGCGALAVLVALLPEMVLRFLAGLQLTVIDYSSLPPQAALADGGTRTAGGGYMVMGEYRRALLQSAPFVALIALFAYQGKLHTPRREWVWLCWLALVPAAFCFFYSLLRWDGGFSYDMRYYLPALPFLAMLAAQSLHRFALAVKLHGRALITPLCMGGAASLLMALYADGAPMPIREWLLLHFPLWMWLGVLVAGLLAFYDKAGVFMRQLALMLLGFVMLWGGATSMLIIYPHLTKYKNVLHLMSASYANYVEPKSIVISVPRYFTSFFDSKEFQLHVATIYDDSDAVTLEAMHAMITHFLDMGWAVYITHDMKSMPYIQAELGNWGMKLVQMRPDDPHSQTPALSRFVRLLPTNKEEQPQP